MTKRKPRKISHKKNVCPICGKMHDVRQDLGIFATREEADRLMLINNRISASTQASQLSAVLQQGVTKEQVELYMSATLNVRANAMLLQSAWWREMIEKYALPKDVNVYIDYDTCAFFIALGR